MGARRKAQALAVASRGVCEGLQVFRTRNENWTLAEARSQWPADEAQELAESARSSLWTAEVDLSLTPLGSKLLCGFFSAGMLDYLFKTPKSRPSLCVS